MNNVLGDALQKAMDIKKSDYSSFVWKGEKKKDGERKYVKMRKRYVSNKKGQHLYNIKYINANDFRFKGILPDTDYLNAQNKTKKSKKK
jgi:hypothetical protein